MKAPLQIDVTQLKPSERHSSIMAAFEGLPRGQALLLSVDHDPQALNYEFRQKHTNNFAWDTLERGPEKWLILITRLSSIPQRRVADLVTEDLRLANVFTDYGIDYCCEGRLSLEEACKRAKVKLNEVLAAMKQQAESSVSWQPHFEEWSAALLIQYILENHHAWERHALSELETLALKVSARHGRDYPSLKKVQEVLATLKHAIIDHFKEEEEELFPMILKQSKSMDLLKELERMKAEHLEVGVMLTELSRLTTNFSPPIGACQSTEVLFHKLREFKQDILQHIHLENTLLVAKAVA